MSAITRLDPDGMRAFADDNDLLRATAVRLQGSVNGIVQGAMLSSNAPVLLGEIAQETGLLRDLCRTKAEQMELADIGLYMPSMSALYSSTLDQLVASLNDDVGSAATVGDNALNTLAEGFALVDGDRNGSVGADELEAAAQNGTLSADLRAAAQYLIDNPVLAANAASISALEFWAEGNPDRHDYGDITAAGLAAMAEQNEVLRTLSDRGVFDELESAKNGENDNRLGRDDLTALLESTDASDEARSVARYLLDNPIAMDWFDSGRQSAPAGTNPLMSGRDGKISYEDVFALTIGQHAFANDPAGANAFVMSMVDQATWTEVSGKMGGIDIRLSSDDGLRALAAAALTDATTLSDQVAVVATMPESPGGVRNHLITFYYADLADKMNVRMNGGVDSANPAAAGHTGANWMMFAPWASNSVGPAIRADISIYGQSPSWADRQYGADGNQYIFGDVGIRYAQFLDAFPAGTQITEANVDEFFNAAHPLRENIALFQDGHRQLRDSFAYYLAAIQSDDPLARQRLTMQGNILIATHEQAGAQHALAGIVDLDVGDDGVVRGVGGEIFGWLRSGSDEKLATGQMRFVVGDGPEARAVFMTNDIPLAEGTAVDASLILDDDLTTVLNPDGATSIDIGDFTVGFAGGGDVGLTPITGWNDPVDGSGIDRFPTDVAEWRDVAAPLLSDSDRAFLESLGQDPDGFPATAGTDASNWADPHQRQWFISNMFHQMHSDPILFDELGDLELDGDWAHQLGDLPGTVAVATEG